MVSETRGGNRFVFSGGCKRGLNPNGGSWESEQGTNTQGLYWFRLHMTTHSYMSHPDFGTPRPGREHNHQVCWDQVSHI
jgi:hypothetical protein